MQFQQQHILIPGTPFGDIQVRYYGIIIVTAMLVAAWVAARLAKRRGLDPDHIWGGLTWAIFPGIVFARLWFVLFPPISLVEQGIDTAWFFENFFNTTNGAIAVWSGGLSIFGAVIGGLLGVWLYFGPLHNPVARIFHYIFLPITLIFSLIEWGLAAVVRVATRKEVEGYQFPRFESEFPAEGVALFPWLDIAAVVLPLAQAIGRWANFVNQELYGFPTNLPWGITIEGDFRVGEFQSLVEYPPETRFHPLFLYESLWNFAAFLVLYNLYTRYRDRFSTGDFFLLYLAQYSFIRFLLEFLRIEVALLPGTGINSSQLLTAAVFVISLAVFFVRRMGQGAAEREDLVEDDDAEPQAAAEPAVEA